MEDHSDDPLKAAREKSLRRTVSIRDRTYDADLGRAMARDAIRVSNGEMTDEEFHHKYHEQVVEEFGFDHRPTAPGGDDE